MKQKQGNFQLIHFFSGFNGIISNAYKTLIEYKNKCIHQIFKSNNNSASDAQIRIHITNYLMNAFLNECVFLFLFGKCAKIFNVMK